MEKIDAPVENGTPDPIVPIDFSPNDGKGRSFKWKFGWIHLFLVVFLGASGTAAWFVLTAKSVYIEVNPITAEVSITDGLAIRLGTRFLVREGVYNLQASNEGYYDLEASLFVTEEPAQTHPIELQTLPGLVTIESLGLEGARVLIDNVDIGLTPLEDAEIEAGEHELVVTSERYLPHTELISVTGRMIRERFEVDLDPAWAVVSLMSDPPGAEILVDGTPRGITPMNAEILQGEREVTIKLAGHKAWQESLEVVAGEDFAVPEIELEPADGLAFIRSTPSDASVTVNGQFMGQTPVEVSLTPGQRHQVVLFKAGFQEASRTIETASDQESEITIRLNPVVSEVQISAIPEPSTSILAGLAGLALIMRRRR